MDFKILNIERDPVSQGYVEGSYDLMVAAWVLHGTPDIAATARNVRKLLKPLGKLVLLEVTRPDIFRSGFAFGLLPAWWLSTEKHRDWSPCLSEEQWHHVLTTEGISGVDFVLPDYQTEDCRENSIMVATATVGSHRAVTSKKTTFVVDAGASTQAAVADRVRQMLNTREYIALSLSTTSPQLHCQSTTGSCFFLSLKDNSYTIWKERSLRVCRKCYAKHKISYGSFLSPKRLWHFHRQQW